MFVTVSIVCLVYATSVLFSVLKVLRVFITNARLRGSSCPGALEGSKNISILYKVYIPVRYYGDMLFQTQPLSHSQTPVET